MEGLAIELSPQWFPEEGNIDLSDFSLFPFLKFPRQSKSLRGLWGVNSKNLPVMLHHTILQLYEEETQHGASWSQHTF